MDGHLLRGFEIPCGLVSASPARIIMSYCLVPAPGSVHPHGGGRLQSAGAMHRTSLVDGGSRRIAWTVWRWIWQGRVDGDGAPWVVKVETGQLISKSLPGHGGRASSAEGFRSPLFLGLVQYRVESSC